ncbi:MAG: MmgE/PrpD family protein [Mycobacteriaceae bacterium]|uniref:MmgE/PrpD family protein n=1 Tax=Corynebacterium sp. TaxID=1720 RepID=UPI003F9B9649
MTVLARQLGGWVSTLQLGDVPSDLTDKARDHLLDTLGAGIVGDGREPTRIAAEVFAVPGTVPLLVDGSPREPSSAARVNAVAVHSAEIDDTEGCDHSGAVVVPALMSASHDCDASGYDLLTAMIAGYEVGRRVQSALGGYDAHNSAGWHSTATCGVFAASAASARMLGLDSIQTTSALAIAASSSAGTWAFSGDGSMTKQLHVGNAAGAGYQSAVLAKAGATGPSGIFDDVWGGYFRTHGTPESQPHKLVDSLGTRWEFSHSAIKMYAACRSAHPAIDGVLDLLRRGDVEPSSITGIRIEVSAFLRPMICPESPRTVESARMSLPISLALLLLGNTLGPDSFERFASSEVARVLELITVVESDNMPTPQTIRVVVRLGEQEHVVTRSTARGGETDPFTSEEITEKFRRLTGPHIGTDRAQSVIEFVDSLGPGPMEPLPRLWSNN